jgi:chromosome partitioning protein
VKAVATYSIKGGVGKTSAAVNLGALAAADGLRTLIWDLDPQGAASFLLRIRPKVKGGARKLVRGGRDPLAVMKGTDIEGLDLLPADFSSISLVSESVFTATDLLLVPIVPSTLSLRTFEQLQDFLARADGGSVPDVLAFLSMVDRRRKLHRELTASLPVSVPAVTDVAIPAASIVELMGARREPVVLSDPRHRSAVAYRELWSTVAHRLGLA